VTSNILLVIGAIVFAIGYFRKSRNIMLLGTVLIICGAGYEGMVAGWRAAR